MSGSPQSHFFIVRPDGTKTPLIAVDELPSNFHILGVPPSISDAQTQGMVSLGLVPSSGRYYVVQQDENSAASSSSLGPPSQLDSEKHGLGLPRRYTAADAGLSGIENLALAESTFNDSQERCGLSSTSGGRYTASQPRWHHAEPPVDETQAIIDALTRVSSETPTQHDQHTVEHSATSSSSPAQGKKIYCNYWLRKGECDYLQQGCMYKHEMPLDKATLASLGLREVPRWYREQWASVAASARTQGDHHVDRPWRASKSSSAVTKGPAGVPLAPSPASTPTKPDQLRQPRVLSSKLPPPSAIRAQKGAEMSEQRPRFMSNGASSSTKQSCNGSNGSRLAIPSLLNTAQPVPRDRIGPNTLLTPARATGPYQPTRHRTESRSRHKRERAPSPPELLVKLPAMSPSRSPIQLHQAALQRSRQASTSATFYPGVPRTASPAHPRLFIKQGQEKFAINPSMEVVDRSKTAVGHKASMQHVENQSSKMLDIFGDLGI